MCPDGFHGDNCQNRCNCTVNGRCDHVTGACHCSLGWMGSTCDTICPPGRFGPGCIHTCTCQNGGSCDPVSGCCGCTSGYYGQNCEIGKHNLVMMTS